MNEPIIVDEKLKDISTPSKATKKPDTTGHSDRDSKPAEEQNFENDRMEPAKVFTAKKEKKQATAADTKTQDENVDPDNKKDATNPDLDHTLPHDYRAKNSQPVVPGKTDDEKGLDK